MQTLQQLRAKKALESISNLQQHPDASQLVSRASELPFMIHANGLGQAAAFFKSKKDKDGYGEMYRVLNKWMVRKGGIFAGKQDLMVAITECDLHTYRVAQAEAMQYMDWVKKFAKAYLSKD
jgi:CRISPR-associated protein Cmr5